MEQEVEGMNLQRSNRIHALIFALCLIFGVAAVARAKRQQNRVTLNGRDVTILVTAHPHNERSRVLADSLKPEDFSVREDNRPQRILSVKRTGETPPIVAVVIQDNLVSRVSNEIRGIKSFIRGLPEGSRVMTGYISVGSLRVTQDFTTDRERAAASLRILVSSQAAAPFSPYEQVLEALRRFDTQPQARRIMLLVSDGLDVSRGFRSASPALAVELDRAIDEAQRRSVAVFAFYAPSVGLTSRSHLAVNFGQGCLNRMADETGGDAFFSGTDFVTFDPHFKELNYSLGHQWLITYRSENLEHGFRKIEVKTDYDLELLHPSGYRLRTRDIPRP
jgi:VWFA-related protein